MKEYRYLESQSRHNLGRSLNLKASSSSKGKQSSAFLAHALNVEVFKEIVKKSSS